MKNILTAMQTLPVHVLRPSAAVDFLQFFAGTKPAVRVAVEKPTGVEVMRTWCRAMGYDFDADAEGYICVAKSPDQASTILAIDRQSAPHEIELGQALGYPLCCSKHIALIGESFIDAYADSIAAWLFEGDFGCINPVGYSQGNALISHLPCSPTCVASLAIARQTYAFLATHTSELAFMLPSNQYLKSSN